MVVSHDEKRIMGSRNLAVAIVKNAYSDYWDLYCAFRRGKEIKGKEMSFERIEDFFRSEWYSEILCGMAPMLCRLKFEEFKKDLPGKYEEFVKSGKRGYPVEQLFVEIEKENKK